MQRCIGSRPPQWLLLLLLQFGSSYDRFSGCGGAGSWDATWLEFKNLVQGQQMICVDLMRLYS